MKQGVIFNNVSFAYQKNSPNLNNINLTISQGSFFGITGVNGSGKTTITYLINGLIPHQIPGYFDGNVLIDNTNTRNKSVSYFANKIGMVFQNPDLMLFNLTVKQEIEFGLKNLNKDNHDRRIADALSFIGMEKYLNNDPQQLSYGEKQKICLACILAQDTPYIVLDEPTAMLDYKSSVRLYRLLKKLNNKGKTIIIVEHDTDFLYQFTEQAAVINQGKIILSGPTKNVFSKTSILKNIGIKIPYLK